MLRRKKKSKISAPGTVYFGSAKNPQGHRQLCVWAECHYSGRRVGPVWGHVDASVRRVMATLTGLCDCGRRFHKARRWEGHRVAGTGGRPA